MTRDSFVFRLAAAVCLAVTVASCSTTRVLEDGQERLASNKVKVVNDKRFNTKKIESYIKQKPNSSIVFGWNPFLILYNWSGKDADKPFNRFIRKLGTAPVIYQPSLVDESAESIERHLEYLGYYGSKVTSEVRSRNKKVDVTYSVELGNRYTVGKVTYSLPEGEFRDDFYADTANVTVKTGTLLSEDALEKETERSAAWFRRNGYFGFTKNFYSFEADTIGRKDTADLVMIIREYTRNQTKENSVPHRKYIFGDVTVSYDKDLKFNDKVLRDMNTVRSGAPYDETEVNTTYSRLSALRLFNGVSVSLTPRDTGTVDCSIDLQKSRMQGFKINLEGSTNSSGLVGISPQLSYYHKNIFHGGQWLNLGFLGNFQFKYNDRSVRSDEFGVSASISFPEFLGLPNTLFKGPSVPRTEISASYNFQNRPEYTRNMISTSFGYTGSLWNSRFFYQFYPVQAKIVSLSDLDPTFYNNLSDNPFLRDAYQNHFDVGSGLVAYYTTNSAVNPKESYRYARLQLDASGNVISLFNKTMKTDEYGSRLIWNTPYSQYIRTEITLGKTTVFGKNGNRALAARLQGGAGFAYGNSSALPFEKQFYSGGANSMRGWQARALGPGASAADTTFVIPSQTGDFKLEANLEYRFPLFWKLCGAVFTDVGNVWTLKEADGDDGNHTTFSLRSIAADWGLGLRLDLNFLILRLDSGFKLHDPSLGDDCWRSPSEWLKRDGFSVHFGVGYPF